MPAKEVGTCLICLLTTICSRPHSRGAECCSLHSLGLSLRGRAGASQGARAQHEVVVGSDLSSLWMLRRISAQCYFLTFWGLQLQPKLSSSKVSLSCLLPDPLQTKHTGNSCLGSGRVPWVLAGTLSCCHTAVAGAFPGAESRALRRGRVTFSLFRKIAQGCEK